MSIYKMGKIVLAALVLGGVAAGAQAATSYTYDGSTVIINWDDYTGKITGGSTTTYTDTEGTTYTFTDADGNTISFNTAEVGTAGTKTKSFDLASTLGNGTGSGDTASGTYTLEINDEEVAFTVNYLTNGEQLSVIKNSNGNYSGETGPQNVTGYFKDIQLTVGNGSNYNGAIYNYTNTAESVLGTITAGFINCGTGDSPLEGAINGGVIFNRSGSINEIKESYFINNSAGSTTANAYGGAIYNNTGKIGISATDAAITDSYFINNIASSAAESGSYYAQGGAIYNSGTMGVVSGSYFIGNIATAENMSAYGGAIYNVVLSSSEGTIGDITGSYFIGNKAESTGATGGGGAIYSSSGTMGNIKESYFVGNSATSGGGAIYNYRGTVGDVTGSYFLGNEANGGAAIYNSGNSSGTATIGDITGSYFVGNTSTGGGAIYNNAYGTMGAITGSYFLGNEALNGAAIYNAGTMTIGGTGTDDTVYFAYNTATPNGETEKGTPTGGSGGAISNGGDMSITGSYFVENTAANGGALINSASSSKTVTIANSYFMWNTATNENGRGAGIYNDNNSFITSITGSYFVGNEALSYGGAIYNQEGATVGSIEDSYFIENKSLAETDSGKGNGGAIENAWGTSVIGNIARSYFIGNEAIGETSDESYNGGAIYNEGLIGIDVDGNVTGDISYSEFVANKSTRGGAIYNADGFLHSTDTEENTVYTPTVASITSINNTKFLGNSALLFGGAVYNGDGCSIGEISDNIFVDNIAQGGNGGAVENAWGESFIGDMDNNVFIGNKAEGGHNGGAIYNEGFLGINDDGEITGGISNSTFIGNEAANGGAIFNNYGTTTVYSSDSSGTPVTDEDGNQVYGTDGELLYSSTVNTTATISYISQSYFEGNTASESGGAIYNADGCSIGTITNTSFIDNTATALGGAIYSASDIAIAADGSMDGGDVVFSGNTAGSDDNAIYMASSADGETSTVTFELSNEGTVMLADNIRGDEGYSVNITGDSTDTTFYLWNDVYYSNLSVGSETGNLTLHTINNDSHAYNINSFTLTGDFKMVADMDLYNGTMDRFVTYGEDHVYTKADDGNYTINGDSKLTVAGLNIISDANSERIAVYFAEPGLMDSVHSDVGTLPGSEQQSVYSPVFTYDVNYIIYDDGDIHDEDDVDQSENYGADLFTAKGDGGYYVLDRTGINPAAMATSIAAMGAYSAFGLMFDYNFEHSDYYMKLPEDVRIAQQQEEPKEGDPTKPAYYNQHELTYRGAWMRAFTSNEGIDYGGGWSSRDRYAGAMVGFDTKVHEHDNGWESVFTGYMGAQFIRQDYSGGRIKQHGGFMGITESFYKKNFYTAWTIAAGTTKAHEYTMYGQDKTRIDQYGIAGRVGWNIKLGDEGKFSLLPTFTASFTYVNPEDFTSAAGTHFSGDGFYAVQLNPNVKFIWNREDGWQPYLTVGEVWTVGEHSKIYANGCKLDELDLDPYTEYGIGVQKRWAYEKDAYVQVLGHSHGRDGILVNAGIRWNF